METKEKDREPDMRDTPRKSGLPCGARYCHRCTEDCGVIVNAYIQRDLVKESEE